MNVLAIGAHPDDIELGCGGTLLEHRDAGHTITLLVMTTGERGPQTARSRIEEQVEAARLLGADLLWGGFEDGFVPPGRQAVEVIEAALATSGADIVYTHSPRDTHQDHRATSVATTAAGRRCSQILFYEAPTSQSFQPSVYIPISDVEGKLDLLRVHMSQVLKNGLVDLEAVEAQARHRGFQARTRNAEGFETERFLWKVPSTLQADPDTHQYTHQA